MANSRKPTNLFDPFEQYFGPAPEADDQLGLLNGLFRPQRLSKEEQAELQEQQRKQAIQAHAAAVAGMLLQDQTYLSGSPKRKELMLKDWEETRWAPYAAQVFGPDKATAAAVKRAVMEQVRAPLVAQREEEAAGPGVLRETGVGALIGLDRLTNVPLNLLAAFRDLRTNSAREELAELQAALPQVLAGQPYTGRSSRQMDADEIRRRIAELETTILPERVSAARDAEAQRRYWADNNTALAAELYAPFANRRNEELRQQELAQMGSNFPLLAFGAENPGAALRRAPGFLAEQIGNAAAIGVPATVGGLLGGPPGAIAGAGLGGAALGAGYESAELADRLAAATPQELAAMPRYNELLASGASPVEALDIMRQSAMPAAAGLGALEGGLLSALGPETWAAQALSRTGSALIPRALGQLVPGAVTRRAANTLAAAGIEGFQEGLEDVIVNAAMNQATGRLDPWVTPQTVESAALGAAAGAVPGIFTTHRQIRAPETTAEVVTPDWQGYYTGLRQQGFTPSQSQYMAQQIAAQIRTGNPVTTADIQGFYQETLPGEQTRLPFMEEPGTQASFAFMNEPTAAPPMVAAFNEEVPGVTPGQLDLFGTATAPQRIATPPVQQQLNFETGYRGTAVQPSLPFVDRSPYAGAAPGQQAFDFTERPVEYTPPQTIAPVPPPPPSRAEETIARVADTAGREAAAKIKAAQARVEADVAAAQLARAIERRRATTPATPETRRASQAAASLADTLYQYDQTGQGELFPLEGQRVAPEVEINQILTEELPGQQSFNFDEPVRQVQQQTGETQVSFDEFVEQLRTRLEEAGDAPQYARDNAEVLARLVYTIAAATTRSPAEIAARVQLFGGERGSQYLARQQVPSRAVANGAHQRIQNVSQIFFGPDPNPQAMTHEFYHFFLWEALQALNDTTVQNSAKTQLEADMRQLAAIIGIPEAQALDPTAWRQTLPDATGQHATKNAQERVAYQFTRYMLAGEAPTTGLQGLFARIAAAMRSVFRSLQHLAAQGVRIDPAYTQAFDEIFNRQMTQYGESADGLRGPETSPTESAPPGSTPVDSGLATGTGTAAATIAPSDTATVGGVSQAASGSGPGGPGLPPAGQTRSDGGDYSPSDAGNSTGGTLLGSDNRLDANTVASAEPGERGAVAPGTGRPDDGAPATQDRGAAARTELTDDLRDNLRDMGWTDEELDRWQRGESLGESFDEVLAGDIETLAGEAAEVATAAETVTAGEQVLDDYADDPAGSGTAPALTAEAQEQTTWEHVLDVGLQTRNEDLGSRSLGSVGQPASTATAQTLTAANPSAEQTVPLVRRAWEDFQRTAARNTPTERAYAAREFNQVMADAVLDSTRPTPVDPFYLAVQNGPVGQGLAAVGRNAQTIGLLFSETDLVPGRPLADGGNLRTGTKPVEGLPAELGYVAAWLRQNGTFKDGETLILIDRPTGTAYAVTPAAKRWEIAELGSITGRRYDTGRAMAGLNSQQETVTTPMGPVVVDSLFGTEGESIFTNRAAPQEEGFARPGDALKTFAGDILYVGDSFDAMNAGEVDLSAVIPEGAAPENVLDILSAHPQGTPVQAAGGNAAAQAMLDAVADPKFADVAYNAAGNPVVDQALVDTLLQHSLDAERGQTKPTSGDLYLDGAEGSLSAAGRQTLRRPQSPSIAGGPPRVTADFIQQINAPLQAGPGGPVTGGEFDSNRPDFFSPDNQFGPAQEIRRSRTLGTTIAQAVETTQAVFNQWLADVEPMVDTEQENHPLRKATMLAFSQTAATTARLQQQILEPIAKIAQTIGRKYGKTATQVKNELDQWTTARHVLEASPVFRQTALVDRIAAEQNAQRRQQLEAQLRAYDALQAMPAEESLQLPWNKRARVVGGMTINEAQFIMENAQSLYELADIEQYADAVVQGFAQTTDELVNAGIVSPEERAAWQQYRHFVSLTTDVQSNVASVNDVAPFLRVGRFDYARNGSQVQAEGALAALEKKVSRTASALGGREMGYQLMAFIDRNRGLDQNRIIDGLRQQDSISAQEADDLRNNRPTTASARALFDTAMRRSAGGLIRVPMASIRRGMQSERSARAQYYKLLNETPGVVHMQKRRDNTGRIRNVAWKVMFDPRGDRSLTPGTPEAIASAQHHAELNKSMTGAYKSSKLTKGLQTTVGRGTRLYSGLLVKFRPYIAPGLAMKDFIGRVINLAGREVQGPDGRPISGWRMAAKMMQMALHPNMFADYTAAFFERPGWRDSYFGKYLAEGREAGAFYTIMSSIQGVAKPGDYLKSKSRLTAPFRGLDAILSGNQEYFGAIVPALHYVAMREMGVRPGDAAAKTLELMNFHESGTATPFLSSLYPFFRPTIQDGAAMLRSLGFGHNAFRRSPTRGKIRAWSTVMGLTWAMTQLIPFLRGAAGDDEETETNRYDAIPMSQLMWGIPIFTGKGKEDGRYKFAPGFGPGQFAWVSSNVFDRVRRGIMEPGDGALAIAGAFYRGISPADVPPGSFGDNPSAWLLQMFTPPIGRTAVDLAMNRNAFGSAIHQPSGNVPLGTKKYESGYHTTADIWHKAAQQINETFGVDLFPESLRYVWTETMQGPLSIMTAYLEEDSKYKRPTTISLADKVGAIHTGLGASSYYSAPNNVTSEMFYRYKSQLEAKIQRAGAKTTSPDTPRGGKERLVRQNMVEAGFDPVEIEQYIQLMRAEIAINKLDEAFRKAVKPHRFDDDPAETTAELYTEWREAREALMAEAVRSVGALR